RSVGASSLKSTCMTGRFWKKVMHGIESHSIKHQERIVHLKASAFGNSLRGDVGDSKGIIDLDTEKGREAVVPCVTRGATEAVQDQVLLCAGKNGSSLLDRFKLDAGIPAKGRVSSPFKSFIESTFAQFKAELAG